MRGSRYLQADAKPGVLQDFARDAVLVFTKGAFAATLIPSPPAGVHRGHSIQHGPYPCNSHLGVNRAETLHISQTMSDIRIAR